MNPTRSLNIFRNGWLKLASVIALVAGLQSAAGAAGLMTPKGGLPALTLDEQHVEVVIENGYAVTHVEQVFSNPHASDLEALYSFPVPKQAAVGEFTYWIDGAPVHAEVLEKQAARNIYENQRQQGNEAALLEQDEHRTFDAWVYPVRARQSVKTRLAYVQRAAVDHNVGRYVYPLEEGGVDEERESFWTNQAVVESAFSFKLRLRSAYPVDAVRVPAGSASINQIDSGEWEVIIDSSNGSGAAAGVPIADGVQGGAYSLDKDIVVYWRLDENLPGSVDMVSYRAPGAAQGTFMLTLTPGIDLQPITEGRDWIFVLDMSGSMQGKYRSLLEGVRQALQSLNPTDRFRIVLFGDRAEALTKGFETADAASVKRALETLDRLQPGGSTNLYDGLKEGLRHLDADRTSAIVLVTDGVANVGPTRLERFLQLMNKVDIRLFTAVMGNSANEPLLQGLTRHAEGFAVNVSNNDDMVGLMMQVTSKVTHEAMHDVSVTIDGVRTTDMTPNGFTRVYRGEQLVMLGKYSDTGAATLKLDTRISGEHKTYRSDLVFPAQSTANPELERLWAFATIENLEERQDLLGETADTKQAITDIALQHGLVTDYTSLVVAREEVFQNQGIERRTKQRIENEHRARTHRTAQPIAATRQDSQSPAFQAPRHTMSNGAGSTGGGSLGGFGLLAIFLMCSVRVSTKRRGERLVR